MMERKLLNTKNVVLMGMFGALAAVLMLFEVPLPFLAPSFYGLDFAEVPMLVGTFALGPAAGIVMQIVKILIKLILKPTSTGFVGEFANVVMSCALILPAGFIYRFKKSKTGAVAGMAVGTVLMAVVGVVMNALVMIPFYSNFMPIDTIIKAGAAVNPAVSSVWTLAIFCVGPFNLVKGALTSMITAVNYKRISVLIHGASGAYGVKKSRLKKA